MDTVKQQKSTEIAETDDQDVALEDLAAVDGGVHPLPITRVPKSSVRGIHPTDPPESGAIPPATSARPTASN